MKMRGTATGELRFESVTSMVDGLVAASRQLSDSRDWCLRWAIKNDGLGTTELYVPGSPSPAAPSDVNHLTSAAAPLTGTVTVQPKLRSSPPTSSPAPPRTAFLPPAPHCNLQPHKLQRPPVGPIDQMADADAATGAGVELDTAPLLTGRPAGGGRAEKNVDYPQCKRCSVVGHLLVQVPLIQGHHRFDPETDIVYGTPCCDNPTPQTQKNVHACQPPAVIEQTDKLSRPAGAGRLFNEAVRRMPHVDTHPIVHGPF